MVYNIHINVKNLKFIEHFEGNKKKHTHTYRHTTRMVTSYAWLFLNF